MKALLLVLLMCCSVVSGPTETKFALQSQRYQTRNRLAQRPTRETANPTAFADQAAAADASSRSSAQLTRGASGTAKRLLNAVARGVRDAGALAVIKSVNSLLRSVTAAGHRLQMMIEWGIRPNPDWFDHFIDQYAQWRKTRTPLAWERGLFNLLAIRQGARVLEMCCGDGFNTHHFYSIRAANVVAVDWDPAAIRHAQHHFHAPNVTYAVADVRNQLPSGPFDNILWDASLHHFSGDELTAIMAGIRQRLAPQGVLSGYMTVEELAGKDYHDHNLRSKEDLSRFLVPYFTNVLVFETEYPARRNLYFFASDGTLPFDHDWKNAVRSAQHFP